MAATVSIVAKPDSHATALEYAGLAHSLGHNVLVNFPSYAGYTRARRPDELVNKNTNVLIFIISPEMLNFKKQDGAGNVELDALRIALAPDRDPKAVEVFLIVAGQNTEETLPSFPWINNRQWIKDGARAKQRITDFFNDLAEFQTPRMISKFENVEALLIEIEPGSEISRYATERIAADNISYEIFECKHKIRSSKTFYIHLHRGITISSTAQHIEEKHPHVFADPSKMIVMSIETGQTAIDRRLENVRAAMHTTSVAYLENLISQILSIETNQQYIERTFIEPQVKESNDSEPREFSAIRNWLVSPHPGTIVLSGQGGIGKTWTILNLRQAVRSGDAKFSRDIPRQVIYIASTDIKHTLSRRTNHTQKITLYDLYVASHLAEHGENSDTFLSKNLFHRAIELGNFIVFIDGLDEIIARYRSYIDPVHFFNDIDATFDKQLDAKVVITCRTLFFDRDDFRIPANIRVFELLAFDQARRDEFFEEFFRDLPTKLQRAKDLSDQAARLPNGRYVPFVLDLIRDHGLRDADGRRIEFVDTFDSHLLVVHDDKLPLDSIVGKFCARETEKSQDALTSLSVDQQVEILCLVAREMEMVGGGIHKSELLRIMRAVLRRREVEAATDQFLQHPLISQDTYSRTNLIEFRFDFMFEYFLVIDQVNYFNSVNIFTIENVFISSKYAQLSSDFLIAFCRRLNFSDRESFILRVIDLHETGNALIDEQPEDEQNIFDADSLRAKFNFSIASLLLMHLVECSGVDRDQASKVLEDVFSIDGSIQQLALLDGQIRDDEPLRLDLRGRTIEGCLFRGLDIWSFSYDDDTEFRNCRFERCYGQFSKSSGMSSSTFNDNCQFDDVFERIFAQGNRKIRNSNEQIFLSIKSFIEDFYKQARFREINRLNVERYYGQSNSSIPFKKIYRLMKKHGVISESDEGHYVEVSIQPEVRADAERLITQSTLGGRIEKLARELMHP